MQNTILMLVAAAIIGLIFFLWNHSPSTKIKEPDFALKAVMTDNELEFFHRIRRAAPNLFIFPQVALSALLQPTSKDPKARFSLFKKIAQKRVDYAVYDESMEIVCIVELDDKTHDAKKDAERDLLINSASVQTIRWNSRKKPSEEEIKKTFDDLIVLRNHAKNNSQA